VSEQLLADLKARIRVDGAELRKAKADADQFSTTLRKSGDSLGPLDARLQQMGTSMRSVGQNASRYVTLPLVAAGAAAVKLSVDFDQAFSRMQGLAGVSAAEVDGLRDSVLELASATGRGPQELAEALYFIRSAGISGAAALDVLESSAKAAASGLGSTQDVANAVTGVLGAYGEANITAAEAVDILVTTAREGKAEASELAGVLGRITPVAAAAGIEFEEVGGALAFLTRSMPTDQAATAVASLFNNLVRMGPEAKVALAEVGLSAEQLQSTIANEGLVAGMQLLGQAVGDNREVLGKIVPDMQGFNAALQFTGPNAAEFGETMAGVADHLGALEGAFQAAKESDAFKLQQAVAELQVAAIELGAALTPLVATLAGFGGSAAKAFSGLPGAAQDVIILAGALAFAVGPLLTMADNLGRLRAAATKANLPGLASAVGALGPLFAGAAVALAGYAAVQQSYSAANAEAIEKANQLGRAYEGQADTLRDATTAWVESTLAAGENGAAISDMLDKAGVSTEEFVRLALTGAEGVDQLRERMRAAGVDGDLLTTAMTHLQSNMERVAEATLTAAVANGTLTQEQLTAALTASDAATSTGEYGAALELLETNGKLGSDASREVAREITTVGVAARSTGGFMTTMLDRLHDLSVVAQDAENAANAIDRFTSAVDELLSRAQSTGELQDQLQSDINSLAASMDELRENGVDFLDPVNESAIRARGDFRGMVDDAGAMIQNWREAGVAGDELRGNIDFLYGSLLATATGMGISQAAAETLLAPLLQLADLPGIDVPVSVAGADEAADDAEDVKRSVEAIPWVWTTGLGTSGQEAAVRHANDVEVNVRRVPTAWNTGFGTSGQGAAVAAANGVTAAVRNIPLSWRSTLTADAAGAWAGAVSARAAIDSVPTSKVSTIYVRTVQTAAAGGGVVHGRATVGEEGWELALGRLGATVVGRLGEEVRKFPTTCPNGCSRQRSRPTSPGSSTRSTPAPAPAEGAGRRRS
jgi:TP901 family phage tail tape measure protein